MTTTDRINNILGGKQRASKWLTEQPRKYRLKMVSQQGASLLEDISWNSDYNAAPNHLIRHVAVPDQCNGVQKQPHIRQHKSR